MTTRPKHILIVQNGVTDAAIAKDHGSYPDWFVSRLTPHGCTTTVVPAYDGTELPAPEALQADGVILTGSPLSVVDQAPWVLRMGTWALAVADAGTPVLAVCFGHQAVGEVLGGQVQHSPNGREYGTITLELTDAGRQHPIFSRMPPAPRMQSVHGDALSCAPRGATLLASTPHTYWQAFNVGPLLTAVQFHPELRPETLRALCLLRNAPAEITDADDGNQLLANWVHTIPSPESPLR